MGHLPSNLKLPNNGFPCFSSREGIIEQDSDFGPFAQELEKQVEQAQSRDRVTEQATPQRSMEVETSKEPNTVLDTPASTVPASTMGDSDEEFIDGFASHKSKPKVGMDPKPAESVQEILPEILPDRQPESAFNSPATPVVQNLNTDGTQSAQPSIPEPEPFQDPLNIGDIVIPDIQDAFAPKFKTGEHHLSDSAIASRAKRIFTPRVDGTKKVSEEIWNDWKAKGKRRQLLQDIFKQCGYDPETCLV